MPSKFKPTPSPVWDNSMRLPPGGRHPRDFAGRLRYTSRTVGSGIAEDPKIRWINDKRFVEYPDTEDKVLAIEAIVREQTHKLGLSYVWIAKESHGTSVMGVTREGEPIVSDDDNHITLRMGTGPNVFNLHGHFYLIYEGNQMANKAIRMMEDYERGVVGGRNPQLWVWGAYPREYGRSSIKYPKIPFEIKPGSILDRQMQREHEEGEIQKELGRKTQKLSSRQ